MHLWLNLKYNIGYLASKSNLHLDLLGQRFLNGFLVEN